jgi:hypothetical protein
MSFFEFNRNVDCPYCGETQGTTIAINDHLEPVTHTMECFNCDKIFKIILSIDIEVDTEEMNQPRKKK